MSGAGLPNKTDGLSICPRNSPRTGDHCTSCAAL